MTATSDPSATNLDTLLGRLVVEQGLASNDEVQHCIEMQRTEVGQAAVEQNQATLANLLVKHGVITRRQLDRLAPQLDEQKATQQIPGYRMLKKIGSGAMATVYLAKQLSLDRKVAIKVLPKKYSNSAEFVERFYAEGRAAAKLNHTNIVQAYDVGKAGEFHYFVMEYVDGWTVYDEVEQKGPYAEERALEIITQISRALAHAHKKGFIHRDVKPKNIMITRKEGVAKLADMGLARAMSDHVAAEAEQGKAFGTPYYISPEQIKGEVDVDRRADVYSLAATFYHMVTGQVPFEGPNPSAVMHRHLKSKLVPPDHINPALSQGIGEIIEVAMAKDKRKRYTSMSDLLQDLESVSKGGPPHQARKRFDLRHLSILETSADPPPRIVDATHTDLARSGSLAAAMAIFKQPAFWAALTGWLLAALLLILHFMR